ncbi:MAG: sterol desaturase family protein [Pseudomonadota bacterium]
METLRQLQQHLPPLALDFFRLCVWLLLLMAMFIPLERLCARRRQQVFRPGFGTDLAYYFLNSLLPKILLALPLSMLAMALHRFAPGELYARVAQWPLYLRFSAALIVGELGAYWGHRWSHEIPLLWRFHAIHHGAEQMDWLVNTRAHPLDMAFTRLCGLIPLYALGLAQPAGDAVDAMPLLYAVAGTVWGFFIHANVRWRFGLLEWLIATPAFHHWHHVRDGAGPINRNYAAMLPCVDKLFGTLHLPGRRWPARYGIDPPVSGSMPEQLLQPFERR